MLFLLAQLISVGLYPVEKMCFKKMLSMVQKKVRTLWCNIGVNFLFLGGGAGLLLYAVNLALSPPGRRQKIST